MVSGPVNEQAFLDWFRREGLGWFDESGNWFPEKPAYVNGTTADQKPTRSDATYRRARAYVAKMPAAIAGQGGHNATFRVACELVLGFGLTIPEAMPILQEYNLRCQPPWSEKELIHKLRDADKRPGPRGQRLARKIEEPQEPLPGWVQTSEEVESQFRRPVMSEFPINVFPPTLQRYALSISNMIGCPVDFPACAMLVVAATCIGNSRALALKRRWKEAPRFYIAIVADPSEGKSPAIDPVCRPIFRIQEQWEADFERQSTEFEEKSVQFEMWRRSKNKEGRTPPESPTKPLRRHLFTTNSTVEKLADMMKDTPRGFMMIQDEITSWVMGLNQYKAGGKGNDRQFFLSAWSGSKVKVDRKSDTGTVLIGSPFLNVLGGIQPDMLSQLKDEDSRRDGFVERVLFTFPNPAPLIDWNDLDLDEEIETAWLKACEKLATLQMEVNDLGRPRPHYVRFTYDGKKTWIAWYNEHMAEMRSDTFPAHLKSAWSKLRSYAARLCLVVHLLRWTAGEVVDENLDSISVGLGCHLADYFKSHTRKTYARLWGNRDDVRAEHVYEWIVRQSGKVTARDITRNQVAGIKKSTDAADVFKDLADRGLGKAFSRLVNGEQSYWFEADVSGLSGDLSGSDPTG